MTQESPRPNPKVSILIVTWNSARVVGQCLESVKSLTAPGSYEVVVIDNAGPDDTVELIKRDFPWARLFETGRNVGFARAVNLAAGQARGEYLFLLNPDARLDNDAVGVLAAFLEEHPQAGAAGPEIREAGGGRALAAHQERPTLASQLGCQFGLNRLLGRARKNKPGTEPEQGGRLSGSAMMIPVRVWREVGPLNEELPMYFEDLDLSARIQRSGRELWRVPRASVTHLGELSAKSFPRRRMLLAMENGQAPWMYFRVYQGRAAARAFNLIIFLGSLFRLTLMWTLGLAALISGRRGRSWRGRIINESRALLGWSWGSKKDFITRVQYHFYGTPGRSGKEARPEAGTEADSGAG